MSVVRPKYTPLEDACEDCCIERGVVLSRRDGKLRCWKCWEQSKEKTKKKRN